MGFPDQAQRKQDSTFQSPSGGQRLITPKSLESISRRPLHLLSELSQFDFAAFMGLNTIFVECKTAFFNSYSDLEIYV